MSAYCHITVDTSKLDRLLRVLPERTMRLINSVAIRVQADARLNTTRVDTGAMKNGWAAQLVGGGGDVARIESQSSTLNPSGERVGLPLAGRNYAIIGNLMEYAYYWEVGHRSFPPELMLTRAIEKNQQPFTDGFNHLCDMAGI